MDTEQNAPGHHWMDKHPIRKMKKNEEECDIGRATARLMSTKGIQNGAQGSTDSRK